MPANTTQTNLNPPSVGKYEQLIKQYRYSKPDSAIYYADRGLELAQKIKDSSGMASILLQMGMIDDNQGEFDSAQAKYKSALVLFQSTGSKKGMASTTIRIGVVELRNGRYDNAIKHFLEALRISEANGDKYGIMEANYSISWAWLDQKNYDAALQYLQLAEHYNQMLPLSNTSLNIYNHFGVVYRETRNYQKAKYYLTKGIKNSNKPEYQGLNITLINNLASVYANEGKIDKAISLQEEALYRSRKIGNYLRELQTLLCLSKYHRKRDTDKAISYLQQGVALARAKGIPKQEIRFLSILTEVYKAKGDYKEALATKEREHALSDTFFYKKTEQNIVSLKAEYELSKSTARLKELNLINKRKLLELRNASLLRNVYFAGLALLLLILCLLYNQYRIKQKNSLEVERKNIALQRLVQDKELLLKEVHHRVKNNLQTIISLLETQSAFLKDDALAAVQNSQHRVYAMSLIHQKLYQGENSTIINMGIYLPELLNYLQASFDQHQKILFKIHIENIQLDISQAIPVGLILNEAITNSIKYAFPHTAEGVIHIGMERTAHGRIRLSVSDNGVGIPAYWRENLSNTLGLRLMKGLSEDLQASFVIEIEMGTKVVVEFEAIHFVKAEQIPEYPHLIMSFS